MSQRPPAATCRNDYAEIEAAVMETERGRWFLDEFARRNRQANTAQVLEAIAALHGAMARQKEDLPEALLQREKNDACMRKMRTGLLEMARAIAATQQDISPIEPDMRASSRLVEATGELGAIVKATEVATSSILSAAENLQSLASIWRAHGHSGSDCDRLEACATDIYAACTFQDLTAQRTSQVIDTLRFVEDRIARMLADWDIAPLPQATQGNMLPVTPIWPADPRQQAAVDAAWIAAEPEPRIPPAPPRQGMAATLAEIDALPLQSRLYMFR